MASVLVGLHRSGVLDLLEDLSQLSGEPGFLPAGRRACRLFADETLSPLREVILAQVLRPEKYLEIIMDKQSGTARLVISGAFSKRTEEIALNDIVSVETGIERFEPENKDGADFVQKISVQHGSPVPGLGEAEEFVTLYLIMKDGAKKVIYAGNINEEPDVPVLKIRKFLST